MQEILHNATNGNLNNFIFSLHFKKKPRVIAWLIFIYNLAGGYKAFLNFDVDFSASMRQLSLKAKSKNKK
jgi:hypothetical protein